MKYKVDFISIEEDEKDLILSFVIPDDKTGVISLILHRTLFFEELLPDEERGVNVSLEGDHYKNEDYNMLESININNREIGIKSNFREYLVDISNIQEELPDIIALLKKQNYDNRFNIQIA